jgi:hypothetical protein
LRAPGRPETTTGTRVENMLVFARHGGYTDPWLVTTADIMAWAGA